PGGASCESRARVAPFVAEKRALPDCKSATSVLEDRSVDRQFAVSRPRPARTTALSSELIPRIACAARRWCRRAAPCAPVMIMTGKLATGFATEHVGTLRGRLG